MIEIQRAVAEQFRVPLNEFRGKNRARHIVHPKQVAMYLCRKMTNYSYQQIGWQFGNCHHATVIHAVKAVERRISKDRELAMIVYDLYTYLKNTRSR